MSSYFQDLMRLREVSQEPLIYEGVSMPVSMGNARPIAYGGYTSALAIQAAFYSLPGADAADKSSWAIYSQTGHFLGPTALDRKVQYTVTKLRDTRSFATRFIIASQDYNGKARKCMSVTVDFIQKSPSAGPFHSEAKLPLSYSLPPSKEYPPPDELVEISKSIDEQVKSGQLSTTLRESFKASFSLSAKVNIKKLIPGSIMEETKFGMVKRTDTPMQKSIPNVLQRRAADYFKPIETLKPNSETTSTEGILPLNESALHAAYLAFVIDEAIAFYPLVEHGLSLFDAGACSTLDFATRFHEDELNMEEFHLREMRTYCASRERTFNESLLWNREGKLIASCSQQCVLRPMKDAAKL